MQITEGNYQKILHQIQNSIQQAENKIIRDKVEMAWQIGKIIDESFPKKQKEKYGRELIKRLERDTLISETVLYKMHSFYQAYRKLPKDDPRLNWSHYRVLSGVKKMSERKALEDLTRKNSLSAEDLQEKVTERKASFEKGGGTRSVTEDVASFEKGGGSNSSEFETEDFGNTNSELASPKSPSAAGAAPPPFSKGAITTQRGKLFSYKISKLAGSTKYFLDCGFDVFREVEETLPHALRSDGQIVKTDKENGKYSLKKSAVRSQQIHTYVAYLERVVDGDTIRVNLDLGFGIFHHEKLRLAKISAEEMDVDAGKQSAEALREILKDVPVLIIKTNKTDTYGRYIADVFFAKNKSETDLQKIADEGIYLNQLLLTRGLAKIFN